MANVKVVIEEIVKGGGKIDSVTKDLTKLETQTKKTATANISLKGSYTEFMSALSLVQQGLQFVKAGFESTVGASLQYAEQVRQLSKLSGESAESTSRMIQVLDDYKVSAEDVSTATRAMTQNGITPNIQAIAKLSDEYLAIQDPMERNKFIIENLGRSGLQWVDVLNQGSDALLRQAAAVDKNLVLNEKQLQDARKLEVAWDNFTDTLSGVGNQIGTVLTPILTEFVESWTWATRVTMQYQEAVQNGTVLQTNWLDVLSQTAGEVNAETDALAEQQKQLEETGEAVQEATVDFASLEQQLLDTNGITQRMSQTFQGLLSSMFTIQKETDSYNKTLADLGKESEDLTAKKNRLTLQMWEEQRAGKMTNEEYLRYVQQLDEVTKAQEENTAKRAQADEDLKKASQQRVYDLAQQKLAADGVVSTKEFNYLQNLAVTYGLVSREAANAAMEENRRADSLVSSFEQTLPPMERSLQVMQSIAAYNGQVVNFGVNFNQTGQITTPTPYSYNPGVAGGGASLPPATRRPRSRDSGGSGVAGTPYMIGTGAQPEMFIPNTNGTFVPNAGKMGATYNITINNPIPERSENSVRNTLKKLSYLGTAA